ncbi:84d9dc85-9884-4780-b17a-b8728a73b139 [Sclerotinia trifoliorum]|uniref:84d9dc85-9884-4780-b17a-b8728a73b139 n=1 Tax=Sclerotinia trifoliorum TaxID=28548 RepID=A0A8H2VVY6_9HELO|nr:84d9dc85-9884-4780-b17a-b8728a73b139 [Sclerotinia trifoliorum]
MNPHSPSANSSSYPNKRARHSSPEPSNASATVAKSDSPRITSDETVPAEPILVKAEGIGGAKAGQSSSFRNVSACNRCRLRKNRCDQNLPSCASCEKAGHKCVGYDPITKREIPRSYVYYLETRTAHLESLLLQHNIAFAPAEVLEHSPRPGTDPAAVQTPSDDGRSVFNGDTALVRKQRQDDVTWNKKQDESEKVDKMMSNIESVSVQGASDKRYLGSTSGISFARVVFAAVRSSVSGAASDTSGVRPSRPPGSSKAAAQGGTSMRDSFFGLHTKPTIKPVPFPDKEVGKRLVDFYFEHANPQIPILHRGEFMKMFEEAYATGENRVRTPRELYMLNIVFAIGAGIFLGDTGVRSGAGKNVDGQKSNGATSGKQSQPEEYHASAIVHLEACLSSSVDRVDGFGGGLEELQAVLLLAGFALLRPVAPGLWYIIGVAVRLAVDLGLHYEDGKDIEVPILEAPGVKKEDTETARLQRERAMRERGRREYIRDYRRRLWWCTYSFDRLVSTCVGRPFGITDQVVTTEFPSLLDDRYITPAGLQDPEVVGTSYKHVAYHYFRLRLLQSEILQVLQHQQALHARAGGANMRNPFMHTQLPSPFLVKFDSFRSWRIDIDKRLWEWKTSAPTKREMGVEFSTDFLELNYWQCVIMLYRQSLSVPPMFEGEFSTSEEVESPSILNVELREDEERVFLKVAEAGQRVLRLYRQLHRVRLVNYTFLATHHLFMAGISFLYAIWHSKVVRSRLTMDEVDFTILAATSVLGDLIEKCPPAEACRDAFDRMSKATVQMCMSTTGFGSGAQQGLQSRRPHHPGGQHHSQSQPDDYFNVNSSRLRKPPQSNRPKPQFDMGLNDLFTPQPPPAGAKGHSRAASGSKQSRGGFVNERPHSRNSTGSNNAVKTEFDAYRNDANSPRIPSPNFAVSPPFSNLDNNMNLDPNLFPTQQSPVQGYTSVPGQSQNSEMYQYDPSNGTGGNSNAYNFDFENTPGLGFLNYAGPGHGGMGGPGENEWDFSGFDMGFGENLGDVTTVGGVGAGGGPAGINLLDEYFFGTGT